MRCLFDRKRPESLISLNAMPFEAMKHMARLHPWVFTIKRPAHFINLERRSIIKLQKPRPVTNWQEHKFQGLINFYH